MIKKALSTIKNVWRNQVWDKILRGMTPQQLKHSLISISLLAVLCTTIWLYEIVAHIGWKGLTWIRVELLSPYFICFLIATAYIQPFWIRYRNIDSKLVLTTLTLTIVNVSIFLIGDIILRELFLYSTLYNGIVSLLATSTLGLSYFFVTDKLIFTIKRQYTYLFLGYSIVAFILGVITNFFIRGFGSDWGLIDAIKMGFPQFWLCFLIGFIGIYISSSYNDDENTEGVSENPTSNTE